MKVGVILNPVAGGGGLSSRWPEIANLLTRSFGEFEMRKTEQAGDAATLAIDFAACGYDLVIAAGGDGTASEVADGLLKAFRRKRQAGRAWPFALRNRRRFCARARPVRRFRGDDQADSRDRRKAGRRRPDLLCRRPWRAGQPPFHQHCQPRPVGRDRPRGERRQAQGSRFGQGAVLLAHRARIHPLLGSRTCGSPSTTASRSRRAWRWWRSPTDSSSAAA